MLVDPSNSSPAAGVTGAIRQAAQATGTSFNYLLATAQVESGLNPQAGAATSSARGLFQFIDQTWLATMKQTGAALGYGRYAAAITQPAPGRYEVTDPVMRSEILKLRNDPTANAVMAGAFTRGNAAALSDRLGRPPSEAELYIAHFLGAGGAAKLITLAASRPSAKAADFFPTAARANSSIFYDRSTGTARSVAQVRNILTARYDLARNNSGAPAVAQGASVSPTSAPTGSTAPAAAAAQPAAAAAAAAPDTAGIANAFAAAVPERAKGNNQVFHGLFVDTDRAAPVAAVVSQLWGAPNVALTASSATGQKPAADGRLDLFKDPAQGS